MFCVLVALCLIEAQAYGANEYWHTRYAYLKLNGVAVWQASWAGKYPKNRGVNVMIVDPSSCTLHEWHNYDTYSDPGSGARLLLYLDGLSDGTVVVGVSCDSSAGEHLSVAVPVLNALGADVSDVGFRGAWVFAAVKGDRSKTVFDKELTEKAANERQPRINVTFGRCDLHGVP